MTLLKAIRARIVKSLVGSETFTNLTFTGFQGALSPEDYTPAKGAALVGREALIGRAIGKWISTYSQAPLVQVDRSGNVVYGKALDMLLGNGQGLNAYQLMRMITIYRLLTGTAIVLAMRAETGRKLVEGFAVVARTQCKLERDPATQVPLYWTVTLSNHQQRRYELHDVLPLPWMVPDPYDPTFGIAPIQACFTDGRTREEVALFVSQFLKNGAVPGTIVSMKNGIPGDSDDSKEMQRRSFEDKFSGGNRHKSMLIEGDVDVKTFAHGLKDLAVDKIQESPELNICAAFAVPPQLIDAPPGLRYGKYDTDSASIRKFVQNEVSSIWAADGKALTDWLRGCGVLLPAESVMFDLSGVKAMQEEEDKKADRIIKLFTANLITRDQAQSELGYSTEENQGAYLVDITRAMQPQPAPTKALKAYGDDSDDERAAIARWKSIDEEIAPLRARLEKSLGKAFDALREEVTGKSLAGNDVRVKRLDPAKLTSDEIRKRLLDATEEDRTALTVELIERAVRDADIDMDTVTSWLTEARRATAEQSVASLTMSADTVAGEIAEIIKANPNATRNELIDLLGDHIATVGASRVATIATTTATQTNATAQNEAWEAINKRRRDRKRVESRWMTQRDGKVRDSHAAADGSKKDKDGFYTVGGTKMKGPGLGTAVEEIANCRCVQVPEIIKVEE